MASSSPGRASQPGGSIDIILFDLDGTLIDTTDLISRSYQHALTSVLGQPMAPDELFLGYGQPLPEAFGSILAHRRESPVGSTDATLVDRLIASYREFNVANHDLLAREFPGVRTILGELGRRGYVLGLVTSKGREIATRGLRLLDLTGVFHSLVFMEDSARHKPHPDPIWVALDRLGARDRPRCALYVGDSTHDLRAGRAAGVRTAGALWGPFPPESLAAEEPDYLLRAPDDLLDLLAKR
ncbi:MAG: HAD-IA family hydrolase [Chloroflexota bacterium]